MPDREPGRRRALEAGRRALIRFTRPPVLVVMGVAGSGKSTVGRTLADRLGWDLGEGDALHPAANIAKMAAGHPLSDTDRTPWLAAVREWIDERVRAGRPGVITCSALKRSYRDVLRDEHVVFVHLAATREQLLPRLVTRTGHFMPAALLDSQFADLETPDEDEQAITVDATWPPEQIASSVIDIIRPTGSD